MKKIAERIPPIVSTILIVGERVHSYRLAPIKRLGITYATKTTVRAEGRTSNIQHHLCWCVPTNDAWDETQATYAAYQAALTALADSLRELGRYPTKLAAVGGVKKHPEPLSTTVICCPDPDSKDGTWFLPTSDQGLPKISRHTVSKHSPKMLTITSGTIYDVGPRAQAHYSVCPTDADWERIETLYTAAEAAAHEWRKLLDRLGTYATAHLDQRYRALQTAIQPSLLTEA